MKITITTDEGEVYVVATKVQQDERSSRWLATDEEGEEGSVDLLLAEAWAWERHLKAKS